MQRRKPQGAWSPLILRSTARLTSSAISFRARHFAPFKPPRWRSGAPRPPSRDEIANLMLSAPCPSQPEQARLDVRGLTDLACGTAKSIKRHSQHQFAVTKRSSNVEFGRATRGRESRSAPSPRRNAVPPRREARHRSPQREGAPPLVRRGQLRSPPVRPRNLRLPGRPHRQRKPSVRPLVWRSVSWDL